MEPLQDEHSTGHRSRDSSSTEKRLLISCTHAGQCQNALALLSQVGASYEVYPLPQASVPACMRCGVVIPQEV